MGSVGTVYVRVVPEARGFQQALNGQISLTAVDDLGQRIGKRLSSEIARGIGRGVMQGLHSLPQSRRLAASATNFGQTFGTRAAGSAVNAFHPAFASGTARVSGQQRAQAAMSNAGTALGTSYANGIQAGTVAQTKKIAKTTSAKVSRIMGDNGSSTGIAGVLPFTIPQNQAFAALSSSLALAGGNWQKFGLAAAGAGAAVLGATLAVQGTVAALRGVASATAAAYSTAGQYEQTIVGLTTLMGSAQEGQEMFVQAAEFAKQTPFEFPQVAQGIRQLKAYGFAADDLLPILTDIGDAASALSLGPEGIQRLIMAFGQIRARGTFQADEARQLTEAGIPAWRLLADAYSEATGKRVKLSEVMDMARKKEISSTFAIKALREGMQDTFGGGMQKQALTLLGTISNLQDSLRVSMGVALQPSLKPLAGALQGILVPLERVSLAFGSSLGPAVTGFASTVMPAFQRFLTAAGPALQDMIAAFGPRLAQGTESLVTGLQNALPLIIDAGAAFGDWLVVLGKTAEVVGTIAGVLGNAPDWVTGPLKTLASGGLAPLMDLIVGDSADAESALLKVKATGISVATELEKVFTTAQLGKLGINTDALKAGDIREIQELAAWSDEDFQIRLGLDPESAQAIRDTVVGLVEEPVLLELTPDVKKITLDAEKALSTAAAQISASPKAAAKFGIDPVLLQSGDSDQIDTLLSLDNKTIEAKLGVSDAGGLKDVLRQYEQMRRYVNQDMSINVDIVAADAAKVRAQISDWTANDKKVLVKAGIDPATLANLSPKAIEKLAGKPKVLAELGVKNPRAWKSTVMALLGVHGGKGLDVTAKVSAETAAFEAKLAAARAMKFATDKAIEASKPSLDVDGEQAILEMQRVVQQWQDTTFAPRELPVTVRITNPGALSPAPSPPSTPDDGKPFGSRGGFGPGMPTGAATRSGLAAYTPTGGTSGSASGMRALSEKDAQEEARKRLDATKDYYQALRDAILQGERRISRMNVDQLDAAVRDFADVAKYDANKYTRGVVKQVEAIADGYRKATRKARGKLASLEEGRAMRDDIENRLLGTVDFNRFVNPASLARNLDKSATQMETFAKNVSALKLAGASDGLIEQLGQMDPAQAAKLTERMLADPSQLQQVNAAYNRYAAQAFAVGDKTAGAIFNTGKSMGQGLKKGLESQEKQLLDYIETLGEKALKRIKRKLGIKSPSAEFAKVGDQIVAGLVQGISAGQPAAISAVSGLVTASAGAAGGTGGAGGVQVTQNIYPRAQHSEVDVARQTAREFAWMLP